MQLYYKCMNQSDEPNSIMTRIHSRLLAHVFTLVSPFCMADEIIREIKLKCSFITLSRQVIPRSINKLYTVENTMLRQFRLQLFSKVLFQLSQYFGSTAIRWLLINGATQVFEQVIQSLGGQSKVIFKFTY